MTIRKLRKTCAIAIIAIASTYTQQLAAAPVFTFTEYSGFAADVGKARYSSQVTGDIHLIPATEPVYRTMSWPGNGNGRNPRSSLELVSVGGPTTVEADTWTTISTLTHNNLIVPGAVSWKSQNIWGRLIISDADGTSRTVVDSESFIRIALTETANKSRCPAPNPLGTICDDYFTFTAGLEDLFFTANDGSEWMATFRFANMTNAVQIANTVFTGEGTTSSLDVQMLLSGLGVSSRMASMSSLSSVPEPAALGLLALGLFWMRLPGRSKRIAR